MPPLDAAQDPSTAQASPRQPDSSAQPAPDSQATWRGPARALLTRSGCREDISDCPSLDAVATRLAGSGFDLGAINNPQAEVWEGETVAGALIKQPDGAWLAVLGGCFSGRVIGEDGSEGRGIRDEDRAQALEVRVLRDRGADLTSVRPFLARHRRRFVDLFVAALIVNVFALVLPLFSSFVYDKILGNGIVETLWALVFAVVAFAGIEFCVRVLRVNVAEKFSLDGEVEIDIGIFRNLLDTPANRMPALGNLIERYKQILSYRDFISSSYVVAMADVPFILLFLVTITIATGPLVLVSIVCGALMIGVSVLSTPAILDFDREAREAGRRRFSLLTDVIGAREAIAGGAFRHLLNQRWRAASTTAASASSRSRVWRGMSGNLLNSISYFSFVGVLVGGVYLVESHSLTSGGLLAASMLTSRCVAGFSSLITLMLRYREFRTALRELGAILPQQSQAAPRGQHGRLGGTVCLDTVTCALRAGDRAILHKLSLVVPHGQIVGIAGAPGAGKTTLLRLIAGVLSPDEGRILIDGIPLTDLSSDDLGENIGYKPQDLCLLEGTIDDNIRAGRPPLDSATRQSLLSLTGLGRCFEDGTLHWHTEVGPRGSQLSGGQRQLVALARALHTLPPVLLLDEPTNGLDAPLEGHIARQIAALRGRCTVLVSTHSRSLLEICDRIIVVGQGRLLADGPREKILV